MPYLLDSDWLIDRLADRPEAIALVDRLEVEGMAVSVITYMEALQGIDRDPDPPAAEHRLESFVRSLPLLDVTPPVARRCATIRRAFLMDGRRVNSRALDLLIAATAIENNLILVTRNARDYRDIPGVELYTSDIS